MSTSPAPVAVSTASRLYDLQVAQLNHDESFHKDVAVMPLADRIKHMALHHAKYLGYFVEAVDTLDDSRFQAVLTDSFIITLATGNTLNQNIGQALDVMDGQHIDLRSLGSSLTNNLIRESKDGMSFVKAYARVTGRLAKACEAWDHMEDIPYISVMRSTNLDLIKLVIAEAALRSLDLEALFRARLRFIERRSIFHPTIRNGRS